MNTVRGRNVAAFIEAFYATEHRGPTAREVSKGTGIDRAQLPRIVQRLERQGRIGRDVVFEPRILAAVAKPNRLHQKQSAV